MFLLSNSDILARPIGRAANNHQKKQCSLGKPMERSTGKGFSKTFSSLPAGDGYDYGHGGVLIALCFRFRITFCWLTSMFPLFLISSKYSQLLHVFFDLFFFVFCF